MNYDLGETVARWTRARKIQLLREIDKGALTPAQARERYAVTAEEL